MKNIYLAMPVLIAMLMPVAAFAADLPAFPMSFWGTATIDGSLASSGSIVRAYYGTELAGQVTLTEAGTYGYNDPIKQRLIVKEGAGPLVFTIQSPQINNGTETAGNSSLTYAAFTAGNTVQKNLAFTSKTSSPGSSGGGGGGGSSSSHSGGSSGGGSSTPKGEVLGVSTSTASSTEMIALQKQIILLLTELISLLQQKLLLQHAAL